MRQATMLSKLIKAKKIGYVEGSEKMQCVKPESLLKYVSATIIIFVLLVAPASSSIIEGLAVNTYGGLVLNSLSINAIVNSTNDTTLILNSQFEAKGIQPIVDVSFTTGTPTSNPFGNATVLIDLIGYYVPGGGKNIEWGTYFNRFYAVPTLYSNEVSYRIDLAQEVDRVFTYFSSTVSNLTKEDIWFAGRFFIETQFVNSTGRVSDKRYLRFPFTFGRNITVINLDITFPAESDLTMAKFGAEDMIKILPNRVQTSFSALSFQGHSPELYAEWKMPKEIPETPLLIRIVYDPIFLTVISLIVGSIIGRYPWVWIDKRREKKRVVRKIILELEKAKKSARGSQPINTAFYDLLSSKLLLLNDRTAELVKETYANLKARDGAGYSSLTQKTGQSAFERELEEITKTINKAINALKKE